MGVLHVTIFIGILVRNDEAEPWNGVKPALFAPQAPFSQAFQQAWYRLHQLDHFRSLALYPTLSRV
jgi:hypothetical protein